MEKRAQGWGRGKDGTHGLQRRGRKGEGEKGGDWKGAEIITCGGRGRRGKIPQC